jgi:hypothetical protein
MRGLCADENARPEDYQGGNVRLMFIYVAFLKIDCHFALNLRRYELFGKQSLEKE